MRILQVHERGRLQGRICCKFLVQPEPRVCMDVELTHSILSPSFSLSLARQAWEACVDSCRDKEGGDFVENCLDQVSTRKAFLDYLLFYTQKLHTKRPRPRSKEDEPCARQARQTHTHETNRESSFSPQTNRQST